KHGALSTTEELRELARPLQSVGVARVPLARFESGGNHPLLVAALERDRGVERLAEPAAAVQQSTAQIGREREVVEHLFHRPVEERVEQREKPDREELVRVFASAPRADELAQTRAQQRGGHELFGLRVEA